MEATIKYTLLEMVQIILSAMDSDEVNSINDTVESYQLALLLKSCFYDMATDLQLPEHEGLFQLTASGSASLPCVMTVPSTVCTLRTIKYDVRESGETYPNWRELEFLPLDQFLEYQNGLRGEDAATLVSMAVTSNGNTHTVLCRNTVGPKYFTSFDDTTLLFDSYDSIVDTTLQQSKTQCFGSVYPTFTLSDSFVPALDPTQFSYFLNKAKVRAFFELKQQENPEAAAEARKQKISIQKRKRRTPDTTDFAKVPKYGRK